MDRSGEKAGTGVRYQESVLRRARIAIRYGVMIMPDGIIPFTMPRKRGEHGEWVETVTPEDVLEVFATVEGPVVTSADVADELGISRDSARRKLGTLADRGRLGCRKTAGRVVWWRIEADEDATPDYMSGFGTLSDEAARVAQEEHEALDSDLEARERTDP